MFGHITDPSADQNCSNCRGEGVYYAIRTGRAGYVDCWCTEKSQLDRATTTHRHFDMSGELVAEGATLQESFGALVESMRTPATVYVPPSTYPRESIDQVKSDLATLG